MGDRKFGFSIGCVKGVFGALIEVGITSDGSKVSGRMKVLIMCPQVSDTAVASR